MAKELRCADLMPGCNFVAQGKDENEVMQKAGEHAKRDHGMSSMPPDVERKPAAPSAKRAASARLDERSQWRGPPPAPSDHVTV